MIIKFKRVPNNYISYKRFWYVAFPLLLMLTIFPIVMLFTTEGEGQTDFKYIMGGTFIFFLFLTMFCFNTARNQLASKNSYMKLMNTPILTLTETHLIYKFDELEQYTLPWNQITRVEMIKVSERYKEKLGYISISYSEEISEYVKQVRDSSYIKGVIGDIFLSIMYFEDSLDEVYKSILEYHKSDSE